MGGFITKERVRGLDVDDMHRAHVPERYWKASLDGVRERPDLDYVRFVLRWVEEIQDNIAKGNGIMFYGPMGQGKTSLAVCLVKEVLARNGTALVVPSRDLSRNVIENTPFDEDYSMTQRMKKVNLLVVDDLMAEHQSEWNKSVVERVVRERLETCGSMVITTNAKRQDWARLLGRAIVEGMREYIFPLQVEGIEWRDRAADDFASDMRRYLGR